MKEDIILATCSLLHVSYDDVKAKDFPQYSAFYSTTSKGSVLWGYDGTILYAAPNISPSQHMEAFKEGKRTQTPPSFTSPYAPQSSGFELPDLTEEYVQPTVQQHTGGTVREHGKPQNYHSDVEETLDYEEKIKGYIKSGAKKEGLSIDDMRKLFDINAESIKNEKVFYGDEINRRAQERIGHMRG